MTVRVDIVAEAQEQIDSLDDWWRTHRRAVSSQVTDELARVVVLLAGAPEIGIPYERRG